jgi:hypothetical protein
VSTIEELLELNFGNSFVEGSALCNMKENLDSRRIMKGA